jgi:glycerol uptake facilitator-like aquaporin
MFDLPLLQSSPTVRTGLGQWWSEVVATFGLVVVLMSCDRERRWSAPVAVGAYIAAAYWFTASTSFANPAVTLAIGAAHRAARWRCQLQHRGELPAEIDRLIYGIAQLYKTDRFLL